MTALDSAIGNIQVLSFNITTFLETKGVSSPGGLSCRRLHFRSSERKLLLYVPPFFTASLLTPPS